jgi:CheY-like chemotaxis protein
MAAAKEHYVLLVEDNLEVLEVYSLVLRDDGFRVVCATDGVDALEAIEAQQGNPALIFLDLSMPRMDGAEFCRRKKDIAALAGVPVVVVSATADHVLHRQAFPEGCGIKAVLSKPIRLEVLLQLALTWGSTARIRGIGGRQPES